MSALFEETYRGWLGERWDALHAALLEPPPRVALSAGLLQPYHLDEASIIAARTLDVRPGQRVLDLCAAPGGKSLVLAGAMGLEGELVANERSRARRDRLRRVLAEHLPPELARRARVTGHDASRWGLYESSAYDRVLCDVPCSGERYLVKDAAGLASWRPQRSKQLTIRQFAILAAGFEAVRPGGLVLYCTCAISPLEGDGVIDKLHRKRRGRFELVRPAEAPPYAEATTHGWRILPDAAGGRGPMYFALIRRV